MELTGWGAGTISVILGVVAFAALLFAGIGVASYRKEGKRGGAFVSVLVGACVLLSAGFAFATPTWQQELQTTVALAAPSSFFDDGEATCKANAEQFAKTMADMTMENWRDTNEILTDESAGVLGVGALGVTHFGSVIVDIFVAAITDDDPGSVRVYGDAKDLAKKWGLDEKNQKSSERIVEDGREFFDEVLDHIEEEHSEGLTKLAKLKGALKKNGDWKVADLELKLEKVGDRWVYRSTNPDAKHDENDMTCVREDGRWRLDITTDSPKS